MAHLAAAYAGSGEVALGLQADERVAPADVFHEAFAIAAGLLSVPHAGELMGADSVRRAVESLHADRVELGVRAIEDSAVVDLLVDRGVTLDVCPSSNVQLGVVDSIDTHPLRRLLDVGVSCSINADDPTLFGPSILDEYQRARLDLGLTDEQLAACARASIEASGAAPTVISALRDRVSLWLGTP